VKDVQVVMVVRDGTVAVSVVGGVVVQWVPGDVWERQVLAKN